VAGKEMSKVHIKPATKNIPNLFTIDPIVKPPFLSFFRTPEESPIDHPFFSDSVIILTITLRIIGRIDVIRSTPVRIKHPMEMGRVKKIVKVPPASMRDCLKAFSSRGLRAYAKTK
jgi:hypothetical protein